MFLGNGSRPALDQKVGVIYGIVVGIGIADIQSRPQGFPRRFFRRRAVQNQKRAGRAGLAKHGNQRLGGILHDFFIQRRVLPDIRGKGSGLVKRFPDFDQNGVFPVLDAGPAMNHLVFQIEFPVEGAFVENIEGVGVGLRQYASFQKNKQVQHGLNQHGAENRHQQCAADRPSAERLTVHGRDRLSYEV